MEREVTYKWSLALPLNPADGLSVDLYSKTEFDVYELYKFPYELSFAYDLTTICHLLLDADPKLFRVDVRGVRQTVILETK